MSNEQWRKDRFVDWLADGPVSAPHAAIEASVAHARAHPRRHLVDVGLWRRIMTRIGLAEIQPGASGHHRFAAFSVATAVIVVVLAVVAVGGGLVFRGTGPAVAPTGTPVAPTATPTRTPSPTQGASPSPAAVVQFGVAWQRVTDAAVATGPHGSMYGVISGGPGAIAWGEVYAAGPRIWYTTDGRGWVQATVETPTDFAVEQKEPGAVLDITAGGPGFVAVGSYSRSEVAETDTGTVSGIVQTAIVWTSSDGKTWQRVPDDPVFADARLGQVIAWKGELLAYGCAGCGMESGPTTGWSSHDGVRWTRFTPTLPAGSEVVGIVSPSTDALWGTGGPAPQSGDPNPQQQPPRLTSLDGRTWTVSPLPILGFERLHPLAGGLYLTVNAPASDSGSPAWVSRKTALYRSTDLVSWVQLVADQPVGNEIVAVGDTLIMVGSSGDRCETLDGRCVAAAWRSTDAGSTWQAAPVTGAPPAGVTRSTMTAVAGLPDGTLVAVGMDLSDSSTSAAVWVSPPVASSVPARSDPTGAVSNVLTVTCTPTGTEADSLRAAIQQDGLHVHIRNTSGTDRTFDIEGVGGDSAPVDGLQVWRLSTGTTRFSCGPAGSDPVAVELVDPAGYYVSDAIDCASATSANFDHVENADGPKGDLLGVARQQIKGLRIGDQVEPAGYVGSLEPRVRVVNDGTTVAVAGYRSDGADGWLLTNTSVCAGSGISWAP